jgi:hypothetical protein
LPFFERPISFDEGPMSRTVRNDNHPGAAASQPILVVDGFLPGRLAMAMRHDIDAHFANPNAHRRDTHQVWNYWFVPELYTYLRTDADRVIGRNHVDAFHGALREWSTSHLGMAEASWPYLSLYVPGCRQGWHNDARNGRFAYVYSLTRNERRTTGGETLVLREGDPFRDNLVSATAGRDLYEAIEPRFNRLVIFDDRLPHAVERIDGLMDPIEGRFVLHGHLSEGSAIIAGALPAAAATGSLNEALVKFGDELAATVALYRGPLVFRITIDASGKVESCAIIVDRVIHSDPGHVGWDLVRDDLAGRLKALKFPAAKGRTVLIQPVLFGGRIGPG